MKYLCAVLLATLCHSGAAAANDVPVNLLRDWTRNVPVRGAQRIHAEQIPVTANPVYLKEGDPEPIEYEFISDQEGDSENLLRDFAYLESPAPSLRWEGDIQSLASIAKRWGSNANEWSWNDMAAYKLKQGGKDFRCIESGYTGIGHSGKMQYVRAVVVFSPAKKRELFYASAYMLECRSLLYFQNNKAFGYIEFLTSGCTASIDTASVLRIMPGGNKRVVQTYHIGTKMKGDSELYLVAKEIKATVK